MSKKDKPIRIDKINKDDEKLDKAGKGEKTGDEAVDALKEFFDKGGVLPPGKDAK